MLDIKFIKNNVEDVKKSISDRGMNVDIDELLSLDEKRRTLIHKIGELRATRNKGSASKPSLEEIEKMRKVGDEISSLEKELEQVEQYYSELLRKVPNMIHPDAPIGGEEDFKVLGESGKIPKFDFQAKSHEELISSL